MKHNMPYDDYIMEETQLNCDNQNIRIGFGIYIWAYKERVLHELRLLKLKEKKQ